MPTQPPTPAEFDPQAELIRAAVESDHGILLRSVALLVMKSEKQANWSGALEIAADLLQEAVREALKHATDFDVTRSASAWIRGIAARLLLARRRTRARDQRCVPSAVLGDDAWQGAIELLLTGPSEQAVADRLDLNQALGRLTAAERLTIECRYFRGLEGQDLACALGVPSAGAARVRVCRALQSLRTVFDLTEQNTP